MQTRQTLILLLAACLAALVAGCGERAGPAAETSPAEEGQEARGPHGGRLLVDGDFTLELAIVEATGPPQLQAWPQLRARSVSPADVQLQVELHRLGGRVDRVGFVPREGYLQGDAVIAEPHSFDVRATARHAGREHVWTYESHEGRTRIPADIATGAGIETALAGPGVLSETFALHGTLAVDPAAVRHVAARFPGVLRRVNRRVGEPVRAGETLAVVEANESLSEYAVAAPISGVVTQRHAEPGEQTGNEMLFEIADLSRLAAELRVFPRDRARLRAGQEVEIVSQDGRSARGKIGYIAALGDAASQSVLARVPLESVAGGWAPGQFVEARVTVAQTPVPLAVPLSALQQFRDFTVVFAQVGDDYEVRMLELGRRDAASVEVLGGLDAGTRYVVRNSYLIKADIEKSGASHDH